jgi:sortase A
MTAAPSAPEPSFLPGPSTGRGRGLFGLIGLSARRPGGGRTLTGLAALCGVAGVAVFAFPAYTDLVGSYTQKHVVYQPSSPVFKTEFTTGRVATGAGLTRLVIDTSSVHVNIVVVQGTSVAALQAGAGHYPDSSYPCEPGNVSIAGHRTTYGRPFNKINDLKAGDKITLFTPIGQCVYQVLPAFGGHPNPWRVLPTDVAVVGHTGLLKAPAKLLTLTACDPPGSATYRLVLRAAMVSSTVPVIPGLEVPPGASRKGGAS